MRSAARSRQAARLVAGVTSQESGAASGALDRARANAIDRPPPPAPIGLPSMGLVTARALPSPSLPSTSGLARKLSPSAATRGGQEGREALTMAELDTGGILARRPVKIGRQRQMRIGGFRRIADARHRPLDQALGRHILIGRHADEGGIGSVLEQAANQIREKVAVSADRRIGAAGHARGDLRQLAVERFAHAVQPLELETLLGGGALRAPLDRPFQHARHGQRIVGRDLRIDARPQATGASRRRPCS